MANMYEITGFEMLPSTNMDWYTKAIFGGKIIERGKITPVTGVKDETLINILMLAGSLLQADKGDCGWTPNQIAKLSDKSLKTKKYKINLEQCIDDLERKRTIWMLSPGAHNTELPSALEDATMAMLAPELSKEIESLIFGGDSSKKEDDFDGYIKKLIDSQDAIKKKGKTLTSDNILEEVENFYLKVFDEAEEAVSDGSEHNTLSFYISSSAILKIKMALSSKYGENVVIRPNWAIAGDVISYMDVPFEPTKGIGKDEIVLANSNNLLFGTDLENDLETLRLGQFPAPNDNKIFIDGHLRLGVVIPFEDEVGLYSPNVEDSPKVRTGEVGYDGISPIINGIDQTPIYKLPKVGDLTNQIKASQSIDEIQAIIETEAHTLRASKDLIATGENRINELKGGE